MRVWWSNLALSYKLHIPIQLALLIVLPLAHVWMMDKYEKDMLENVGLHAKDKATQTLLSLNSMMLSGAISNPQLRAIFMDKMNHQHGVTDFYLVRGPAVRAQFGAGLAIEQQNDELDRAALSSKTAHIEIRSNGKRTLRAVVPFMASKDFHGINCTQCHHVEEGTVLGTISLTVDLADEYAHLENLGNILIAGQAMLQLLLFLLIGWIIRSVTGSVVELEQTMRQVSISRDFSKRAPVHGKDEIGHIAHAFNGFVGEIADLQRQLDTKIESLENYLDKTEEELRIGSEIMARVTTFYSTADASVRVHTSPAAHYSGDLILLERTPQGCLHILLADAVGHGLTAALNLLPIGQAFSTMSKKGISIAQIAQEFNSKIHNLMPVDRFVCAALVSVDFDKREIEIWNGGMPAPMLVAMDGSILHKWISCHLPLGIVGDDDFSSEVEMYRYAEDSQLLLFSDGFMEAESVAGEQFGHERISTLLRDTAPGERFDALLDFLKRHLFGRQAHDDVSLAMVSLPAIAENMDGSVNAPMKTPRTRE